jgi:hypothetical protein
VTSYLFPQAKFSLDRLKKLVSIVGRDRLVIDLRFLSYVTIHISGALITSMN